MRTLIIGDGLLGKEIKKQTGWDFISRKQNGFDFRYLESYVDLLDNYDTIVNCVAYTKTYDKERKNHWEINYKGLVDLVDYCRETGKKLIHISTDYIYSNSVPNASEDDVPVHCRNWYGYTKLIGDAYVQLRLNDYLLIRCTHKPRPFPYPAAFINQVGNFDYVDTISRLIIQLIDKDESGVFNVGTSLKTMYDLARISNKLVFPIVSKCDDTMPNDVSIDTRKMMGGR